MGFQTNYGFNFDPALPGQAGQKIATISRVNNAGDATQVNRFTVGSLASAGTTGFTVTINGSTFTGAGTSAPAQLISGINGSDQFDLVFAASTNNGTSNSTLTVSARTPGSVGSFTFSVDYGAASTGSTLTGTAASNSTTIPLGIFVSQAFNDGSNTFRRPSGGTDTQKILGVLANPHIYEQQGQGSDYLGGSPVVNGVQKNESGEILAVAREVWVLSDSTLGSSSTVSVRFATESGLTNTGYLSGSGGNTNTIALSNCSVVKPTITLSTGELVTQIDINIP